MKLRSTPESKHLNISLKVLTHKLHFDRITRESKTLADETNVHTCSVSFHIKRVLRVFLCDASGEFTLVNNLVVSFRQEHVLFSNQ